MQLTILFWNIHRNHLVEHVAALAHDHSADIVCLAESRLTDEVLLSSLNSGDSGPYARVPVAQCRRLATYHRPSQVAVNTILEADRHVVASVTPATSEDIIVAFAHGPSLRDSAEKAREYARGLGMDIAHFERTQRHSRTVLAGDLNQDPFHPGVVLPWALNATPDRRVASRISRTVDGVEYRFFYNPMWRLLGDDGEGPPGSFYWDSDETSMYWHMIDQALLRPELLAHWHIDDLTIPMQAGTIPLVTKTGRPRRDCISDHLPLVLRMRTNNESEVQATCLTNQRTCGKSDSPSP